MRSAKLIFLLLLLSCFSISAPAATARLIKVLPHFLDREGRHALAPSLYERDAYQAVLRKNPRLRSGLRFDVQWKSYRATPLKLRVELRGSDGKAPTTAALEIELPRSGLFSKWSSVTIRDEDYESFGELVAWRATLWDGSTRVAEQKSFLW